MYITKFGQKLIKCDARNLGVERQKSLEITVEIRLTKRSYKISKAKCEYHNFTID